MILRSKKVNLVIFTIQKLQNISKAINTFNVKFFRLYLSQVTLERVLGITVKDNCTLTCDPNTGLVAYVAG